MLGVIAVIAATASLGAHPGKASAQTAALPEGKPCPFQIAATSVAGDPNAATVRLTDVPPVPGSTITALGAVTAWSGQAGPFAAAKRYSTEYSFVVRADGPIEAVVYEPANAGCVARAGVRARNGYDGLEVERPAIALSNPRPLDPIACARRYVAPMTVHAAEPLVPAMAAQQNIGGNVRVSVMLDDRGHPTSATIFSSPSVLLNSASISSALQSTYTPEIFRCIAVPSVYVFSVEFIP